MSFKEIFPFIAPLRSLLAVTYNWSEGLGPRTALCKRVSSCSEGTKKFLFLQHQRHILFRMGGFSAPAAAGQVDPRTNSTKGVFQPRPSPSTNRPNQKQTHSGCGSAGHLVGRAWARSWPNLMHRNGGASCTELVALILELGLISVQYTVHYTVQYCQVYCAEYCKLVFIIL